MSAVAADEAPRPNCIDEWGFALVDPTGAIGLVTGHRLNRGSGHVGYWWCLVRGDAPLLHVVDWEVPARDQFGLAKGEQLWAEIICEDPLSQWTIGNETVAVALDNPEDATGRAHGDPTPVACDLEWYSAGQQPLGIDSGFVQDGVVHGVIEVAQHPPIAVEEWSCSRWRRWWPTTLVPGWAADPPPLSTVTAHTGRRAPVVGADGSVVDFVLVPSGWALRRRFSADDALRRR